LRAVGAGHHLAAGRVQIYPRARRVGEAQAKHWQRACLETVHALRITGKVVEVVGGLPVILDRYTWRDGLGGCQQPLLGQDPHRSRVRFH